MAIHIASNSGKISYNIKEYICDSYNDLPLDNGYESVTVGSTAYVVDEKKHYMFNSLGNWVEVSLEGGGGGGGEGSGNLTQDLTANVVIGSVTNGKTYAAGTSIETVVRDILIKKTGPTGTLSYVPATSIYDVVTDTLSDLTINVKANKGTADITKIDFYVNNSLVNTISSGVAAGGTFSYKHHFATPTNSNVALKVVMTDAEGATGNATATIKFLGQSYYGILPEAVVNPTADQIKSLEFSTLKDTVALEFKNIAVPQDGNLYKIVYAYPASCGNITKIVDGNGFNYTDAYTKTSVTVDGYSYNCYTLKEGTGTTGSTQIYS